jgi:hypothetical protein
MRMIDRALPRAIPIKPFQGKVQNINHPYQLYVQRFSCFRDSNLKVNAKLGSEGVLVEVDELNPTMRAGEEGWFRPSKSQILQ